MGNPANWASREAGKMNSSAMTKLKGTLVQSAPRMIESRFIVAPKE
jgi:hypothetical protein